MEEKLETIENSIDELKDNISHYLSDQGVLFDKLLDIIQHSKEIKSEINELKERLETIEHIVSQ